MIKDEEHGLSIPDIILACRTRRSGLDIDYARAFFPVLGLKWESGMTREQGMQQIYLSQKHHATRVACYYGVPRMNIYPRWAPSYFHGLEGYVSYPGVWEKRGIRGEWYGLKIVKLVTTFRNSGRFVLELDVDSEGGRFMQCACAQNEDDNAIAAFVDRIANSECWVLSGQPSEVAKNSEFARHAILVEKAEVNENDGFEAAVYCAAVITSATQHAESKESVLLRHHNPLVNRDFKNRLQYLTHSQKVQNEPRTLPR